MAGNLKVVRGRVIATTIGEEERREDARASDRVAILESRDVTRPGLSRRVSVRVTRGDKYRARFSSGARGWARARVPREEKIYDRKYLRRLVQI